MRHEKSVAAKSCWGKDTEPERELVVTTGCLLCSYSNLALYHGLQGYSLHDYQAPTKKASSVSALPAPLQLILNMQNTSQRKKKKRGF